MKRQNRSMQITGIVLALMLLSGCAPAATPAVLVTDPPVPLPADTATEQAVSSGYQPVSAEVCQTLQADATQTLGLGFTMEAGAPFHDYSSGESGLGCTLTATTDGTLITDPYDALTRLMGGFIGWTEDSVKYGAGGPTGAASGMTRDSGLLLVSVGWEPAADANCPADQPISMCELAPEQKLYTVTIQVAQK